MLKYVQKLLELGLVRRAGRTDWMSAPLIVPKKPPAIYRLNVHHRDVNAAKLKDNWPCRTLTPFSLTYTDLLIFRYRFFRLMVAPSSQGKPAITLFMTADENVQPTRTAQGVAIVRQIFRLEWNLVSKPSERTFWPG